MFTLKAQRAFTLTFQTDSFEPNQIPIGSDLDYQFVSSIPDSQLSENRRNPQRRGYSETWIGHLTEFATAVVTSKVLATVIVEWIKSKRVKIVIKDKRSGKECIYEGTSPAKDVPVVARELAALESSGEEATTLDVSVEETSRNEKA